MPYNLTPLEEVALANLLGQRSGGDPIGVHNRYDRALFKKARRLGLVNPQGRITPHGERFRESRRFEPARAAGGSVVGGSGEHGPLGETGS